MLKRLTFLGLIPRLWIETGRASFISINEYNKNPPFEGETIGIKALVCKGGSVLTCWGLGVSGGKGVVIDAGSGEVGLYGGRNCSRQIR